MDLRLFYHHILQQYARAESPKAPSPGQAKRHPGLRIVIALTPWKGKSIQCWIIYLKLLPLQGVTNEHALTQGVASLALGYVLLPFQGVQACILGYKTMPKKSWILNAQPNGVTHLIMSLIDVKIR